MHVLSNNFVRIQFTKCALTRNSYACFIKRLGKNTVYETCTDKELVYMTAQNAPYVEYNGKVDKEEHELLIGRLNEEAARTIAVGLLVSTIITMIFMRCSMLVVIIITITRTNNNNNKS
jgi:hypothetical protein